MRPADPSILSRRILPGGAVLALLLAALAAPVAGQTQPASDAAELEVDEDGPEVDQDGPEVDEDGPELTGLEDGADASPEQPQDTEDQAEGVSSDADGAEARSPWEARDQQAEADAESEAEDEEDEIEDGDDYFETAPASASGPAVGFNVTEGAGILVQGNVTTLSTIIEGLTEFLDGNGNLRYDVGEEVLQSVNVQGIQGTLETGGPSTRHINYPLPVGGHLSLVFHLAPSDAHRPAKFDVLVDDFPFLSADSRLAVSLRIDVSGGFAFTTVGGDPALAGLGEDAPFLSWARNVTVDGADGVVGASLHVPADAPASQGVLIWSYPQGKAIQHDPVLGVVPQPNQAALTPLPHLGDARTAIVAALAGLGLLGIGFAFRRRMRL